VDVISAGWLLMVVLDISGEIFRGWLLTVLRCFFTSGATI